jgi:3-deoxy-D-manno-octulosonate 8-phosphate phosphatase (KDO 8-P phosphatase)
MKIKQGRRNIRALVLDVDGVLTDGTTSVSGPGDKRVHLRDLDALARWRGPGRAVAFLTGGTEAESGAVVARCGGGDAVIFEAKDKEKGLRAVAAALGLDLSALCYLADARRDAPALKLAGLALCPADGDRLAREAAHVVLTAGGGRGAVAEAVDLLLDRLGCEGE